MPVYTYVALDGAGKKVKGILEADSANVARGKLRNAGYYPIELSETTKKDKKGNKSLSFFGAKKIRIQEILVATRQLATLLNAGIPLVTALDGLKEQTGNAQLKTVVAQLKDTVNEGKTFSSALAQHPQHFSLLFQNMIKAGEASGSLGIVLEQLADLGEKQQAIRSKVKAALIYPLFMAVVGSGVLFILLAFIVPSITAVFIESEQSLPVPTQILLTISGFLQVYWWMLLATLISFFWGIRRWIRQGKGKEIWDGAKLTLPHISTLIIQILSARFSRTLASLLSAGVPLTQALHIVRNIVNNVVLAKEIDRACQELEKGRSLAVTFQENSRFPPMLIQMIGVGEQSGTLDTMLEKAAESYEKEVEAKVMAITSMIEPLMILIMGGVVAFIVISILLPIFQMNQLIQ